MISKSLTACSSLKKEIIESYANEEMDDELTERYEEELNEANEILVCVMELGGILLKLYKGVFENMIINSILPDFFNVFSSK